MTLLATTVAPHAPNTLVVTVAVVICALVLLLRRAVGR
jgi:hypothetical protein